MAHFLWKLMFWVDSKWLETLRNGRTKYPVHHPNQKKCQVLVGEAVVIVGPERALQSTVGGKSRGPDLNSASFLVEVFFPSCSILAHKCGR